jgi:transcriptional regulator with XRE-family HTH domain
MASQRRRAVEVEATRRLGPILRREGAKVRDARKRRRFRQVDLGERAGLSQPTISQLERGDGGTLSLESWAQVALVLGLPFDLLLGRDALEEPADAGHLGIQELVLRLARGTGTTRFFELPTRPASPTYSTDVGLRNDAERWLIQVECWNTFGNLNASMRSTDRKRAEAESLAIAIGNGDPYSVHSVWVVRATRRNRELLRRYPEIFAARFAGTSRAWIATLTKGTRPPQGLGLVWCDVGATRLSEWRPDAA